MQIWLKDIKLQLFMNKSRYRTWKNLEYQESYKQRKYKNIENCVTIGPPTLAYSGKHCRLVTTKKNKTLKYTQETILTHTH